MKLYKFLKFQSFFLLLVKLTFFLFEYCITFNFC